MVFEEMMRDERNAGRKEGILLAKRLAVLELLEELGVVPEELRQQVECQDDVEKLDVLFKMAIKSESIEQFAREIEKINS